MQPTRRLPRQLRRSVLAPRAALALVALTLAARPCDAQAPYPDEARLQEILGRQALRIPDEGVLHFYWWRREVPVEWQGRPVEVFEGQSLRVSVQRSGDECLASGRFLLFADETIPVVASLTSGGLRVSSVVPRFPGARPQPFELRFLGKGSESELAGPIARAHARLEAIRGARAEPPMTLPTSEAAGESAISVRPLEDLLGRKAEVKDGVALFRLPGPRGLDGLPAGSRMGVAIFAAFAGRDEAARLRLDWTMRSSELPGILEQLAARGFSLESLTAAAPGLDEDLSQVCLVARGSAASLAAALKSGIDEGDIEPRVVEAGFAAPTGRELLGLASGELAAGWEPAATHPAGPLRASWGLEHEGSTPLLRMTAPGDIDSTSFNLLLNQETRFQDGAITLRMRADRGRIDQGGGPVWRVQDADNYYVCRFNPLEQDFRVYHVVNGERVQIQAIGGLPYRSGDWFMIRVEQRGDLITCTLNGAVQLHVRDDSFPAAGGVGIWSKADSACSVAGLFVEDFDGASEEGR